MVLIHVELALDLLLCNLGQISSHRLPAGSELRRGTFGVGIGEVERSINPA